MRVCILSGSPSPNGNTAHLTGIFTRELETLGAESVDIRLYDKKITPCRGCYRCQNVSGEYGCAITDDDVPAIIGEIMASDCVVLSTPIYSWYCTAPMKAMLDRFYGMCKYYGSGTGSLWNGKKVAIITTHGYETDWATEPFRTGVERLCVHYGIEYLGFCSTRDDVEAPCDRPEAIAGAKALARLVVDSCQ